MTTAEKLAVIAQNEYLVADANAVLGEALYSKSEGGKTYYDAFWEQFQNGGEPMGCIYLFSYSRFSDATYNPKYDIKCINTSSAASNMFYSTILTDTKVTIYANGNVNKCDGMFYNSKSIKTVRKLVIAETGEFSNTFDGCTALANITFEGIIGKTISFKDSPLTKASITNVIEHLSSTASGQTATFKKAAKEAAFTEAEWQTLIATKTNWTISLV